MSDDKVYTLQIGADTLEDFIMEFVKAMARVGEFSTFKTDSKTPKTWGKLSVNAGRTQNPFDPSFKVTYPDIRINGLQPGELNLTLQVGNLQKPAAHKQVIESQAATVKADIAALIRRAQAANIDISDVVGNSAGE